MTPYGHSRGVKIVGHSSVIMKPSTDIEKLRDNETPTEDELV